MSTTCLSLGRRWAARIAGALALAALTACGGGGGGGSDSAASTASPSPSTPLALSEGNTQEAGQLVTAYGELVMALGQLSAQWITSLRLEGTLSRTRTCPNGGTEILSVTDQDGSGKLSAGDTVQVQLLNCYTRLLDEPLDGNAQLQLQTFGDGPFSGRLVLGNTFGFADIDVHIGVAGTLVISQTTAAAVSTLSVSTDPGESLGLVWSGTNPRVAQLPATPAGVRRTLAARRPLATIRYQDTLTGLRAIKQVDRAQARVASELQFVLSSEMLNGRLTVDTPTHLAADLDTYPDAGRLTITGANGRRVFMLPQTSLTASGLVAIALDSNGDGQADYSANTLWSDTSFGMLSSAQDVPADEAANTAWAPASASTLRILSGPAAQVTHNDLRLLQWQFSKPITLPEETALRLMIAEPYNQTIRWTFATEPIPLTVRQQGAWLELVPTQPLEPGVTYRLIDAGPLGQSQSRPTLQSNNETLSWDFTITAAQVIQVSLQAAPPGVVSSGFAATLSLSHQYTGTSPLSVSWRQVGGPPVLLSSTSATQISVTAPASGGSNGDAVLEARLANTLGDVDLVQVKLPVIGDALHTRQALFTVPPNPDVVTPGNSFIADYRSSPDSGYSRVFYGTVNGTVLDLMFGTTLDVVYQYRLGRVSLSTRNSAFAPGTYRMGDNLNGLLPFWLDLGFCNPANGSATIHEIETNSDGTITRLALDFNRDACADSAANAGSIRINSDRPLRWP
jgi:hypothetical protein